MKTISDMGFNPKTFERTSDCASHGSYTELGGSLTGRDDRVKWFGCPACNKVLREQEEAQAAREAEAGRQARIEARLNHAGIPAAFRGRSFDAFKVESDDMAHALAIAKEYSENFWSRHAKEGTFLIFGGQPGTGKSHLALAIAQTAMLRGTVMYMDVMDVIRQVRGTWKKDSAKSEADVLRSLGSEIDLLIIDEIGVQRGTEDEQVILFDIINRRYRDLRPTILLTNLSGKAMREFMGPRIIDRLMERAIFVKFAWESWRARK